MKSHFSWEAGFNRPLLLSKMRECRTIGKDGRASFTLGGYNFWLPVLESAVRSSVDAARLKHRCIQQAINDGSVSLKDDEAFLRRCSQAFADLSARPKSPFIAYMSMTYSNAPLFFKILDGDVRIQWVPSRKTKFMREARNARDGLANIRSIHGIPDESKNVTHLLVHVSALDPHDAHAVASDAFDGLRGMLNLFVNASRGINPFALLSRPHAINRFRPGPYRTLHKPDGSLATETFWYEHRWLHESPSVKFKDDSTARFSKNLNAWWSKFQKNPLRDHIRQGLLRYCRALDIHEAEPSLLEMWGALESLTGTQNEKYEVTVARSSRLFRDYDDARQIAHHIRLRRNATVHAARTLNREEADAILIQAESLVSRLLFFCLQEGKQFRDQVELFETLDMTVNQAKLIRTARLTKFWNKYQRRGQAKPKK
jgi:hypothetical protein